jgi:hypothetical protein
MWRLLYPLRYFSLENGEKRWLDTLVTMFLAALIAAPFVLIPGASFFHPNGFLDKLLVLTSALTGFYVAALVAAATFSHPDLDKTIRSGPIALITKDDDGNRIRELLTRREFVCIIFGHLAFATFMLSVASSFLIGLSGIDYIKVFFFAKVILWVRAFVIIGLSAAVGHVIVATALGLYYLMDRMYRHDRKITSRKTAHQKESGAA